MNKEQRAALWLGFISLTALVIFFANIDAFWDWMDRRAARAYKASVSQSAKPASVTKPAQVRKKDGTLDERENDLQILCEDWLFWRDGILKANAAGDEAKVLEYRKRFQQTNAWLAAYRQEDVATICGPRWR